MRPRSGGASTFQGDCWVVRQAGLSTLKRPAGGYVSAVRYSRRERMPDVEGRGVSSLLSRQRRLREPGARATLVVNLGQRTPIRAAVRARPIRLVWSDVNVADGAGPPGGLEIEPDAHASSSGGCAGSVRRDIDLRRSGSQLCALADLTLRCWGENGSHQLGGSNGTYAATPVSVTGVTAATAVAAGGSHTCARLDTGAIWCWGSNESGQLGHGMWWWYPTALVAQQTVIALP